MHVGFVKYLEGSNRLEFLKVAMVTRQLSIRAAYDSEARVWHGMRRPNEFEFQSVGEAINEFLASHPDHLMQIGDDDAEIYICERMKATTLRALELLKSKHVAKGDTVLLLLQSEHYLAAILIACVFLGAKFCLLPPKVNGECDLDMFFRRKFNFLSLY